VEVEKAGNYVFLARSSSALLLRAGHNLYWVSAIQSATFSVKYISIRTAIQLQKNNGHKEE
jgi:hypothetical protein